MPAYKHSFGDAGTSVPYSIDVTTGMPVRPLTTGGAALVSAVITSQPACAVATSGGLLTRRLVATADTNIAVVKNSAGMVYGLEFCNNAAYPVFVKLYNKATAPVLATDVPVMTVPIPAGATRDINRAVGVEFPLGIGIAATKLAADTDVTGLVAGDVIGSVHYK